MDLAVRTCPSWRGLYGKPGFQYPYPNSGDSVGICGAPCGYNRVTVVRGVDRGFVNPGADPSRAAFDLPAYLGGRAVIGAGLERK
ncbi:MAG: hypothetical protein ACP5R4_02940, partial [Armatimonadota bacterium]